MTDFAGLIGALVRSDVEFIIVGGVAATVHGSVRLTLDLDVVYARSTANLDRLSGALAPLAPYLRDVAPGLPFSLSADTLRAGLNFTLTTSAGSLDLFGEIAGGGTYEALLQHSIEIELFGLRCRCLDLPTLIAAKRAAGRPRDLDAIAELEVLRQEIDRDD
jgi:hypothetical protein